jgi:hypothetical protein
VGDRGRCIRRIGIDDAVWDHSTVSKSLRKRKLIEEAFGWAPALPQVKVRGLASPRALPVQVRDGHLQSNPDADVPGDGVTSDGRCRDSAQIAGAKDLPGNASSGIDDLPKAQIQQAASPRT